MSGPKQPDPSETAAAQGAQNRETAITQYQLNATDTYTPFGSTTYKQAGYWPGNKKKGIDPTPRYKATQSFSPEVQGLVDSLLATTGEEIGTGRLPAVNAPDFSGLPSLGGYDTSLLPELTGVTNDFSADRSRIEGSLLDRLNPQIEADRARMETQLANQGIQRGTEAYTNAMRQLESGVNDARLAVVGAAGDEQQRLYEMAVGGAGVNLANRNQLFSEQGAGANLALAQRAALTNEEIARYNAEASNRNRVLGEEISTRGQQFNELASILGLAPLPSSASPQTQVAGVDYAGMVQDNYAAKSAEHSAMLGGIFGLGGAAIGGGATIFSDRRLKRDITRIGDKAGLPWYSFRYLWSDSRQEGLMSDDVRKVRPWAVIAGPGGFDMVNYDAALS